MIAVKFFGIDDWNRPVFKSEYEFYGALNKLFDGQATEKEVLEKVTDEDLVWFGSEFNCEPIGQHAPWVKIIRGNDEK